jgi:hypothetical protein
LQNYKINLKKKKNEKFMKGLLSSSKEKTKELKRSQAPHITMALLSSFSLHHSFVRS